MDMLSKVIAGTQGQARPDMLPMWGKDLRIGGAVVGQYVGADTFMAQDKDEKGTVTGTRPVRFIKLINVIELVPASGADHETSRQHLALGVPLNADTKNKLDPDTLPAECFLLIQFTGTAAEYNNMRRFRVEIISRAAYAEIVTAEAAT